MKVAFKDIQLPAHSQNCQTKLLVSLDFLPLFISLEAKILETISYDNKGAWTSQILRP